MIPNRISKTYKCGTFTVERSILDKGYVTRYSAPTDHALEATHPVDKEELWNNIKQIYAKHLKKTDITKQEVWDTVKEWDPIFYKSLKMMDDGNLVHNKRIHIYTKGEIEIVAIDKDGNPSDYELDKENPGHIDKRGDHNVSKVDRIPKINIENSRNENPEEMYHVTTTSLVDGSTINCISNVYNPQTLPTPFDFWKYDVHVIEPEEFVYIRPEGVKSVLLLLDGIIEINKQEYDGVQEFNISKESRITAKTPVIMLFGAQQYNL